MLRPGMMLCDRYEILDVVGAGGMSIVYKARCHRLNRNVAIKVLKPEFSNDKNFVTKFKIEAQASAGLSHPNIVNVYDVYDDDGLYFIVMELVDGITLKEYIEQNGRLSMDRAIDISMQIASGLEAAHESHVIHRDIKPQNIIVSKNGNIKVTDFGIAKAASPNTLTSGAIGSVHYISPEQARGGYSDERSDIYSLGITMYEMVTGRVPFDGDNNVTIALMHIQNEMIPPRQYYPDIYSSFEKVILKATQKKPERRYLTASALIADLKRVQNNPNIDIVVAPTAVTNSPTQEWTKEDVQAIRDGSAYKNENADAFQEEIRMPGTADGQVSKINGISPIPPINNQRLTQLLEEDDWEDEYEEEYETPAPVKKGNLKKVQDYDEDDEAEYDESGDIDPKLRKAVIAAGIATAVIIAIVIMLVLGNFLGWFKFGKKDKKTTDDTGTEKVEELIMLDVLGYSEDAAVKLLEREGFTNVKVEKEENQEVQEGYVFYQSVEKDKVVAADDEIIIKVSAGAEEVDVPDVKGYTDEQAMTVLTEAGFKVSHAYAYDDEVEEDKVISQSPEAHEKAAAGSTVTITVSNGSEVKEVEVPNLLGKNESEAINAITEKKLTPGTVKHGYSDTVAEGLVMSQDVESGSTVQEGATVGFTISDGPEPKETTYTAKVSGSVTCNDEALDGQAITIRLLFNGSNAGEKTITVVSGTTYDVSASVPGQASRDGSADIQCIDGSGNDVTTSFTKSVASVNYEEE
ncbi:MAG: Stk1 family PASTA domain-containing Ser/Thr kinase [Clostridium sp.]|nr:Stk1 family PASTA domain-containing Ser/Thr kinase [Clostridium sp.]MCM1398214.1 Stk1 family PASTA domain-containing Ser/Thr kinase [Clostridium sp.]MCM1460372.1 Stk1 family PASTA domain-containing Ser/Thr kinase [Bacteroides sp.]